MARSVWTGSLSFGLVSIPVGLYPATREHEVRFHQFERGTNSRIRYRRVNQDTGEQVDYSDIVKGAEVSDGEYVMLTDEELEAVEPERTRAIEIADFVDVSAIDPVYFQKGYYVSPRDESARKPYALLASAAEQAGRAGIASFVLRNKEHLAVVRPYQGILMLDTMFFADEIMDVDSVLDYAPDRSDLRKQDVEMAVNLIESMTTDWEPEKYHDRYTERVNEMVEAKSRNESIEVSTEEQDTGADVVDLTAALRASIDQVRGRSGGSAAGDSRNDTGELSELSKAELYELAQQHRISGRSKMSRDELRRALEDATSEQAAS